MRVFYSEGCHLYKDRVEGLGWRQDRISEALTVAEHSDVVISAWDWTRLWRAKKEIPETATASVTRWT